MVWVTVPTTDRDADSPVTVALVDALYNNVAAMGAGDAGAPNVSGALIAFTKLTAAGSHVLNSRTRLSIALIFGGGGGGGGNTAVAGNCGLGGGASERQYSVVVRSGGETLTIAIGAGGTGVSGANGNVGGNTTLTGHTSAVGGDGGLVDGGNSSNYGLTRGESNILKGAIVKTISGPGNSAAANSGAGGGGGFTSVGTAQAGGSGGSGVIFIWEYG